MSSLNALTVAVELATRQRDDALRALQGAQGAHQAALDQMAQLQGYADETQNRWGLRANAQVVPEVMYHHYQFMDRLGHAMGLQTTVVGDHEVRTRTAHQALLAAELRLASLKKLTEKRRAEWEQLQARRDQKQTDERAALQRRSAFNGP
ncbi:flagellar export protein FliJ [Acidovorax sp. SRB_24]|uniref:flagellar export protein FliJ n=1 Tax=Acidovorax sp. SRB_24 TaxID=1962700 RepID=UPI00145F1840|nr:flagellar export protein FliJ [Acidovorax sp. SRB_24]NMM78336.1 flagellar export protein FliJ [Acidovorax sp. SRB_24]